MHRIESVLERIDGKGYKLYRNLEGEYRFGRFTLCIDKVQSDPFAPPSNFRVVIANSFPEELYSNKSRLVAFEDYLVRSFFRACQKVSKKVGSGNSGLITILAPSQQILRRSCIRVSTEIEVRFHVGLPARGRRIMGKEAKTIIMKKIPEIIKRVLVFNGRDYQKIEEHVKVNEDANFLRKKLKACNLVAFVANGSILPRESGVSEKPLKNAVKFKSPETLEVQFSCPNREISGMGIKEGVTLIVGGAYHGKSTLLNAISMGVYNHAPGDGREFVITREDAIKIRAEDGRYVANVDISSFISSLPNNADTSNFSTNNASGSTSQAANFSEALELGSRLFLIDEDTSATNLMIRDRRMQELIPKDKEPITPLIDLIPSLKKEGVSIIMVAGGIGEYFDVADTVIAMENYLPIDVTEEAKELCRRFESNRYRERPKEIKVKDRIPLRESIDPYVKGRKKIKALDLHRLRFGKHVIDLSKVEQLVEIGQTRAIGEIIFRLRDRFEEKNLREALREVENRVIDVLPRSGDFSEPRIFEIGFAINRLRSLRCKHE